MGLKPIIMMCCVLAGACVGKGVASALSAKRQYFEELGKLARALCGDLRFRRTPVCELLGEEAKTIKNGLLAKNVSEFITYASSGGGELVLGGRGLDERERRVVYDFFASLGRYDIGTQTFVLEGMSSAIEEYENKAAECEKKWAGLAVKLGFLAGAGAGILFM